VKIFHNENYKTLMKEVEEDIGRRKRTPYIHGPGESIVLKCSCHLKSLFNAVPINPHQNTNDSLQRTRKNY
jgi:hypothetical protein